MLGLVRSSVIIILFCGIIISCAIYEGKCSVFKLQPKNKTVKYGEIVQFECQIHRENSQDFYMYFGNTLVYPLVQGNFSALDQRELSVNVSQCTTCLQNQTVAGRVWILINSKTLQIIEPFWCRVTHSRISEDSSTAFIEVVYPECAVVPLQSNALLVTSTFVPPREHPINSTSASLQVVNRPCSTGELNTPGDIKTNKLAISICAALVLVMLTLLILTYVCICIQHRKRLSCVKSSKLSRNQFCNSMVQNPIYESGGPVYDSVQPQFNSQVATATNTCIDLKDQDLEISTSLLTDKNHYVDQPNSFHSGSFPFCSHSNDHIFEDSTKKGVTLPKKEEAQCHTVMNPAGRIIYSSLNGRWDEEELRKDTYDIN